MDELFTITCGDCKKTASLLAWANTLTGILPAGQFQCPHCKRGFKRTTNPDWKKKPWQKMIKVEPTQSEF
jgi:hypothetical protein